MYLSGCANRAQFEAQIAAGIGLMLTPLAGNRPAWAERVVAWAADTGCFSQGDTFDLWNYLDWLEKFRPAIGNCLFATAPDIVGDAAGTLERSAPVLPMIQELGFTPALVGQDGLEKLTVPWDTFGAYFIGGSTRWKLSIESASLVREAKRRGKLVHMGRVNSGKRLVYAARIGCDSSDGTYMRFNPTEAIDRMGRWVALANNDGQQMLPLEVA